MHTYIHLHGGKHHFGRRLLLLWAAFVIVLSGYGWRQ